MQKEFPKEKKGCIIKPVKPMSFEFKGMTGIDEVLLFEDGCIQFLPENEFQIGVFFDTYGCVSFSHNNALETDGTRRIDLGIYSDENTKWLKDNYFVNGKLNFSDRDLVVMSGTNPNFGNDGWTVFETARKWGLVCESDAPWDFRSLNPSENNKDLYYSYKRDKKSEEKALEFLKRFEIKAEWVERGNWLESSKYGVLQVYTKAWYQRNGKYYNPNPGTAGHAIMLAEADVHKIFDQYEPFIKEMERDEDFYYFGLKISLIEKHMARPTILNNTLIMMVSGGGDIGMYLDGRIIKDEPAKILATWFARSSKNGVFSGGLVKSLTKEQWDMFDHVNLKNEPA